MACRPRSPAADLEVERLADGLWRWTAHVDGRDVACLYVESERAISLLDPVVPPEDRERFLRALDRDVERHGGPVHVFVSRGEGPGRAAELVERYAAEVRDGATEDVVPLPDAQAFWIPSHGTLFANGYVASAKNAAIASVKARRLSAQA